MTKSPLELSVVVLSLRLKSPTNAGSFFKHKKKTRGKTAFERNIHFRAEFFNLHNYSISVFWVFYIFFWWCDWLDYLKFTFFSAAHAWGGRSMCQDFVSGWVAEKCPGADVGFQCRSRIDWKCWKARRTVLLCQQGRGQERGYAKW